MRTLRQKITDLCAEQGLVERWSNALAKQWMADEPQSAGVFYADGHVRVYHSNWENNRKPTEARHKRLDRQRTG